MTKVAQVPGKRRRHGLVHRGNNHRTCQRCGMHVEKLAAGYGWWLEGKVVVVDGKRLAHGEAAKLKEVPECGTPVRA